MLIEHILLEQTIKDDGFFDMRFKLTVAMGLHLPYVLKGQSHEKVGEIRPW
jgi:hypothetical protein